MRRLEEEGQTESLLAALGCAMLEAGADGRICRADEAARAILRANPTALIGLPAAQLWANEEEWRGMCGEAAPSLLRRLDGTTTRVEALVRREESHSGEMLYQIILREDKSTAEEEHRYRDLFRRLAENMHDGLSIIQNGRVIFANRRVQEITGQSFEALRNMSGFEFAAPEEQERLRRIQKEAREEGILPKSLTFWIIHPDGTRRYIQNDYTLLRSSGSHLDRFVVTTDITEQKRAEDELRFRADFERMMIRLSTRLINVPTGQMIEELRQALGEVGEFLGVDRVHIFQFSTDSQFMSCIVEWNAPGVPGPQMDTPQNRTAITSPWWYSHMKSLKVFTYSSIQDIPAEETQFRQLAEWLGMQSVLDVPVAQEGRLVGFLGLTSVRGQRVWKDYEIALQTLLAEIIANALARRETEARLQQQMQNMAALHTIDQTITRKTEMEPVLRVLLEQVTGQLRVDAADILLYDAQSDTLAFGEGVGFRKGTPTSYSLHLMQPQVLSVVRERCTYSMPVPQTWRLLWYDEGFVSYVAVPLIARGVVNGMLELYHREPVPEQPEWLHFLNMLAEQAAIAVDNMTMFTVLQRSNQELKDAYDTTLEGWAQALELRDQETEGHSRRVLWLAVRLARDMGITGEDLVHMRRGAMLHDIGKMGIPDSILQKTGPLTEEEWDKMRQHPVLAYELLSTIPFLKPALDVPHYHHERWDGSGYPSGLKGEEIPLAARVFAVVDVWDALRTRRRYREAWDEMRVRDYLRDQAGKHFDPQVVDVFLEMIAGGTRELHYPI
jgi:PAS domain S-box-containing protein